jgi:hypothetical protein
VSLIGTSGTPARGEPLSVMGHLLVLVMPVPERGEVSRL